jgi:hypothetical protein
MRTTLTQYELLIFEHINNETLDEYLNSIVNNISYRKTYSYSLIKLEKKGLVFRVDNTMCINTSNDFYKKYIKMKDIENSLTKLYISISNLHNLKENEDCLLCQSFYNLIASLKTKKLISKKY